MESSYLGDYLWSAIVSKYFNIFLYIYLNLLSFWMFICTPQQSMCAKYDKFCVAYPESRQWCMYILSSEVVGGVGQPWEHQSFKCNHLQVISCSLAFLLDAVILWFIYLITCIFNEISIQHHFVTWKDCGKHQHQMGKLWLICTPSSKKRHLAFNYLFALGDQCAWSAISLN